MKLAPVTQPAPPMADQATEAHTARPGDALRRHAPQQSPEARAAKAFEGLLMEHLFRELRSTLSSNSPLGAADSYMALFDSEIGNMLAEGGGIGLSAMFEETLGGRPKAAHVASGKFGALKAAARGLPLARSLNASPEHAQERPLVLRGATAQLSSAARALASAGAERWSREGTLQPSDLSSTFSLPVDDGTAHFNVRDAQGYRGYLKCNLFAFEAARRAGFQVPLVGRAHGFGYPSAASVADDAADGRVRGGWGEVVRERNTESINQAIESGERAYLLAGSDAGDRSGHMALVERIRELHHAPDGSLARVVFDGWEAREDGSQHLVQRTWNLEGHVGGHLPRNNFHSIEIIELKRNAPGTTAEIPVGVPANRSLADATPSSLLTNSTNKRLEPKP